jgi:hypothetical protein
MENSFCRRRRIAGKISRYPWLRAWENPVRATIFFSSRVITKSWNTGKMEHWNDGILE